MSGRTQPREWTLANPFGTGMVADGPEISLSEEVRVIELEPVVDMLKNNYDPGFRDDDVEQFLRAHGRLQ